MQPDFWHQRWQTNQIGFHRDTPLPLLLAHWPGLGLKTGSQVFVPLCGKSLDMVWLAEQGHRVLGVELSKLAITQFFDERRLSPETRQSPFGTHYSAGAWELICGDAFAISSEILQAKPISPAHGPGYRQAAKEYWSRWNIRKHKNPARRFRWKKWKSGRILLIFAPSNYSNAATFSKTNPSFKPKGSRRYIPALIACADNTAPVSYSACSCTPATARPDGSAIAAKLASHSKAAGVEQAIDLPPGTVSAAAGLG